MLEGAGGGTSGPYGCWFLHTGMPGPGDVLVIAMREAPSDGDLPLVANDSWQPNSTIIKSSHTEPAPVRLKGASFGRHDAWMRQSRPSSGPIDSI